LAELGAEFKLADSDWGQLYCLIRQLKGYPARKLGTARLDRSH